MKYFWRAMLVLFGGIFFLYACGPGASDGETTESMSEQLEAVDEGDYYEDAIVEEEPSAEMKVADEAAPAPNPNSDTITIPNTEEYEEIYENPFTLAQTSPISTFSIDVDNASYSNIRRFIQNSELPPPGAVRIEEMINYFSYNYPNPSGKAPFSINSELASCPWNKDHQILHIGLQGRKLNYKDLKPSNLVFLIDASGSMSDANKLPLLKKSLGLLLDELGKEDRVAIVAYAGAAGLVLPSTPAREKSKILSALSRVESGGSTAGGEGIELAYKIAKENLISGGNNRVILATDGDFNVGASGDEALVELIEEKRKENIYLTICGFGMGNYKDRKMEMISNAGNGNYFYIDNIKESKKVFVTEMRANLFTIAKDVKIQIAFNPDLVKGYRLIGYENRRLRNEDFDDDTKDAGELGAGHTVTALYEIIPQGSASQQSVSNNPDLAYLQANRNKFSFAPDELSKIRLRYKAPNSNTSQLIEQGQRNGNKSYAQSSEDFRFSAAVAGFGLLLRQSEFAGQTDYPLLLKLAKEAQGQDTEGYRQEFIGLLEQAKLLE